MDEIYERTIEMSSRIKSRGYSLTEISECDYDKLLRVDLEMADYVKNHPMIRAKPLEPRDALTGGRTENFVKLYNTGKDEQMRYQDVCSLYPWVCKRGKFPVGHPKVYVGDKCRELVGMHNDLSVVEGLVKYHREICIFPFYQYVCMENYYSHYVDLAVRI